MWMRLLVGLWFVGSHLKSNKNSILFYLFFTSYAMDGLSADKLRIFLQPVETESKPKVKSHENDSAGSEETAITTMPSVAKQDQVSF